VVWTDEIDLAADKLWRLAQEQAGETMTPDAFRHWRAQSLKDLEHSLPIVSLDELRTT
jgi:hypothetical protein